MRLAYLINAYPKVSHSFIRREILELERRGLPVVRIGIRPAQEQLVGATDQDEAAKTHQLLGSGTLNVAGRALIWLLPSPVQALRALGLAIRLGVRSPAGILRHFAYLLEAAYLKGWCGSQGISHLHIHFGTNAATVALLLRRLGGPSFSFTVHGPDEFDAPVGLALCEKIAEARFVTGISHFTAGQLMRWARPEDWHKISVVHMALQSSYFAEATPVSPECRNLVVVGRLSAQKGHMIILEAFAKVLSLYGEATLTLVGDGELRPLVERRIAELGISSRITITGWADEAHVRLHIKNARALVLGSFAEGLPVVLMEALALGRPVVTTSVAGIPELVSEGVGGYIVPSGSVEHLAAAMRAVLEAPVEELNALAAAGRERVLKEHNLETEVAKLEALFVKYAT